MRVTRRDEDIAPYREGFAKAVNEVFGRKKKVLKVDHGIGVSLVIPAVLEDDGALYRQLSGVPVLVRTLLALDAIARVREVVVVIREAELKRVAELCRDFDVQRVRKLLCVRTDTGTLTEGDDWVSYRTEHGQVSELAVLTTGVYECDPDADYIAVHDPLRPFVTAELLTGALDVAQIVGAGAPAVAVKDTIKVVRDGVVAETPERSSLRLVQTPQVVESSLLKAALVRAGEAGAETADLPSALEVLGLPLQLAEGADENIRVAAVTDLPAAEVILTGRTYG
ncbi:MAG: 2-C-methyl-D-erythritol 4-phosphate cytidylyltransferase [Oscillospiraceae bacterium]|nr:2-C-methyl-D-erythritol 4-phosphate cytidylyltransferase [Oscillospiraceae bacterium]